MLYNPSAVCAHFCTDVPVGEIRPVTSGHINDSYVVMSHPDGAPSFLLQRINHDIFKDVEGLMQNISTVLAHTNGRIHSAAEACRFVPLRLIPADNDRMYYRDPEGNFWRMYNYIAGSRSHDLVENAALAREGGKAFGTFLRLTSDLDGSSLNETIPRFHHIGMRLQTFRETVEKDPAGRATATRDEIRFVEERSTEMMDILRLGESGEIPLRVTHNDTKFNNILFNDRGEAVCIVDLDTVMPGYSLYDFGDAIRTGASAAAEDEPDLSKVDLRLDLFAAYAEGYLSVAGPLLVPAEIHRLAFSARLMTYIIGLRFLTDYLDGDHYFRTGYPGHNLVRARSQYRLVRKMEEHTNQMEQIISHLS